MSSIVSIGPSDVRADPVEPVQSRSHHHDVAVRRWLLATIAAVVATLVVGGITRLTESGLSITEWQPVWGALPPLSAADWTRAFENYRQIPEAQTVHVGLTLAQFKTLFWWEWAHRNLGRLVGLIIALPYFLLLARGRLRTEHRYTLFSLPLLTALQGVLGWYMVQSGLTDRTDVSQYRLVAHLSLALVIYVIALWTLLGLRQRDSTRPSSAAGQESAASRASVRWSVALCAMVALTIVSGGFVAGLDAGHIFNTFPLMGDRLLPDGYATLSGWRNLFENPIAAQFNHRLLAMATLGAVAVGWWRIRRNFPTASGGGPRAAANLALALACAQIGLGIATLVTHVPIPLAAAHQLGAVALLSALLHTARESMSFTARTT